MADKEIPQAPPPIYQTPDWETPSHPKRRSLLQRLAPSGGAGAGAGTSVPAASEQSPSAIANETLPTSKTQYDAKPTFEESMRARLDKILPPNRTYFGRSRRFVLLLTLLPLAILLFLVLPLSVGIGVGLSHHSLKSHNLALPSNTDVFTGDLTYYGPGLGACGIESSDSDDIVSVSHILFDAASTSGNPNANPLCGKKIRITRDFVESSPPGNRSVDVRVVDRCTGCLETDLDTTISVFTQLALEESGRVTASWAWL